LLHDAKQWIDAEIEDMRSAWDGPQWKSISSEKVTPKGATTY